jgi:hypothetical protein
MARVISSHGLLFFVQQCVDLFQQVRSILVSNFSTALSTTRFQASLQEIIYSVEDNPSRGSVAEFVFCLLTS